MNFFLHDGLDLARQRGPLSRLAISWNYTVDTLGGAVRLLFEFDREDDLADMFISQLLQFMWEATFERPASDASVEDLEALMRRYALPSLL